MDTDDLVLKHQAPVPLRLLSNVMALHWHSVNVNKMSTQLKLRPTNAGDIVLTFSLGNRCVQMFHCTRLFSHTLLLCGTTISCIMTSQVGVHRFLHRWFSSVSYQYQLIFKQPRIISIKWKCLSMPFNKYTTHVLWLFSFIFTNS